MAAGLVVSRGSPGRASFSSVSRRSSRLTSSPSPRSQRVSPAGPPRLSSIRFAAPLSLRVIAASQSSATVIPPAPACFSVTGE